MNDRRAVGSNPREQQTESRSAIGLAESPALSVADGGASDASTTQPEVQTGGEEPRWLKLTDPPMQGDDVEEVQLRLLVHGFGPLDANGVYDRETRDVVLCFQAAKGLGASGETGPNTRAALEVLPPFHARLPDKPQPAKNIIDFGGGSGRAAVLRYDVAMPGTFRGRRLLELDLGVTEDDFKSQAMELPEGVAALHWQQADDSWTYEAHAAMDLWFQKAAQYEPERVLAPLRPFAFGEPLDAAGRLQPPDRDSLVPHPQRRAPARHAQAACVSPRQRRNAASGAGGYQRRFTRCSG